MAATPVADLRDDPSPSASPVATAVEHLADGRLVVVADDLGAQPAVLVQAASLATARGVATMLRHTSGLVLLVLPDDRLEALGLPLMHPGAEPGARPFTVSVDARVGTTTGISAGDRAVTARVCVDPEADPTDLVRPGHVFPVRAAAAGLLAAVGVAEAALDLTRLAGLVPGALVGELMSPAGGVATAAEASALARREGLPFVRVGDVLRHRLRHDTLVRPVEEVALQTPDGPLVCTRFDAADGRQIVALTGAAPDPRRSALVRVHTACPAGDVLASTGCRCGPDLRAALAVVAAAGTGTVLYLPGDGVSLAGGHDATGANRELDAVPGTLGYAVVGHTLRALGLARVRVLTDRPERYGELGAYGVEVTGSEALSAPQPTAAAAPAPA